MPVTVKCRIGVDEQDPEAVLPAFLERLAAAGVRHVAIHARKAWLQGLSPKENREIPPLDYPLVLRMRAAFPELALTVNGGITGLGQAAGYLAAGLDGVMIGRAAYHAPALLGAADRVIFGERRSRRDRRGGGAGDAALHRGRALARHRRSTRSPATCSAPSRAAPAPAPGGGCCRRTRTGPGPGRSWCAARSREVAPEPADAESL